MPSPAAELYSDIVFGKPVLVISVLLLLVAFFAWHAQDFRLDASADSLLLENDPDLEFSREVNNRYGLGDSVIVAYTPDGDLFDRETLRRIEALREDLLEIDRVFGVDSILNVPVFGNTPLTAISEDYLTIMDEEQDLEMARQEIMESPVFSNALLSPDGTTAGLLVGFEIDEVSRGLLQRRTELRNIQSSREITPEQAQELIEVEAEYAEYSVVVADRQHEMISNIRAVLDNHRDGAQIYLGGAPMIADDLVTFVQGDLRTFSSVVVLLIVVALGLIFRKVRWVAMPLACCAVAGTIMVGVLAVSYTHLTLPTSDLV